MPTKPFRLLLLLLAGVCCQVLPTLAGAEEETDQRILVWRLERREGVTAREIESLSGLLTTAVAQRSHRRVISEADVRAILAGEQKRQQCAGSRDALCMAEIGGALGVPEVVSGDLGRLGGLWVLNLRRIDVQGVRVLGRASRTIRGDLGAVVESLPAVVDELFAGEPARPAADAPVLREVPRREPAAEVPRQRVEQSASQVSEIAIGTEFSRHPFEAWGWTAFGTGLTLVVLGSVATGMTARTRDDYIQTGSIAAQRAHGHWSRTMSCGYALGGAFVITGVVLLLLQPEQPPATVGLGWVPVSRGWGAQVTLDGTW